MLSGRYGTGQGEGPAAMLEGVAKARACRMKGGEADLSKAAGIIIDDFRNGKLGKVTLELPGGNGFSSKEAPGEKNQ